MTKPEYTGMTYFNGTGCSVISEAIIFTAGVSHFALPLTGADTGNVGFSLKGKTRMIHIVGEFVGTEADMRAFELELETDANKSIQPNKSYKSTMGRTYTRMLTMSFSIERNLESEGKLNFTLDLVTTYQTFG